MALVPISSDFFENLTLTTHPQRTFSSSSSGITGSVYVFAERSPVEKEAQKLSAFDDSEFDASSVANYRDEWIAASHGFIVSGSTTSETATNFESFASEYMSLVNSQSVSFRKQKSVEVIRFEPSMRFTADTLRKNVIRDILYPAYRTRYPTINWAVSNYNSLNFFLSGSGPEAFVPTGSVWIYPSPPTNTISTVLSEPVYASLPYQPSGSFTFDFYINPRYSSLDRDGHFPAGTIIHMSSSYAVSLVTGSSGVGLDGKVDTYRLMLQLSHSAGIPPSEVNLSIANNERSYPHDLIFLSDDKSLRRNNWHHVGIRWGGDTINDGSGSFVIDGHELGDFYIPSASVSPQLWRDRTVEAYPEALFVGNFYVGKNGVDTAPFPNITQMSKFFNATAAANEGVTMLTPDDQTRDPLVGEKTFSHPLKAEIHDLKIWSTYKSIDDLKSTAAEGQGRIPGDLLFYLPPYFTKESRKREVLQTPFQSIKTKTDDPFNVALSFGVGGYLLNLENYAREFVRGEYPRLMQLTASTINSNTEWATANQYMFATASIRKRNLSILPCDNGQFRPDYELLKSGTVTLNPTSGSLMDKYTNDFGTLNLSLISLTNLIPTGTLFPGLISPDAGMPGTGSINAALGGASPENLGVAPGSVLTIFQRTRDNSSNQVVFFDASNLFYGNKIEKNSIELSDKSVTGSGGMISLKLKDNGRGGLYRADSITPHAKWANVGNVIYEEGIATVLSPNVPYFGQDGYEITFNGSQNIHILEMNIPCKSMQVNSSSNPMFKSLKPSDYASETDESFVYITGLNFHDENLNIIARTNLAQPVVKKDSDRFLFKVKLDF